MKRKKIIAELKRADYLMAQCPECGKEFRISRAVIFDAAGEMPEQARRYVKRKNEEAEGKRGDLALRQEKLKKRQIAATVQAEEGALSSGIGLMLEKLALGRDDFPHHPQDCRHLNEPIDYVLFKGLTENEVIDSIVFMDVKTGTGKLKPHQRMIQKAVENGQVDYKEI
jgi:predicted Holliday junction resolvase-like endonuclease